MFNRLPALNELCKSGSVSAQDLDGWTPLHYAAFKSHRNASDKLIKHGADIEALTKVSFETHTLYT